MLLLDNKHATLRYSRQDHILLMTWHGYVPSYDYRNAVTQLYEAMLKIQCTHLLSDCRLLPTISATDSQWTVESFSQYQLLLPAAKFAVVLSSNVFTKMSVEEIIEGVESRGANIDKSVITRYFRTTEEARQWLVEGSR